MKKGVRVMLDETNLQMSGTAEGLIAFLEWAGAKGVVGKATAISYRTAVTKVFEIDGESWRGIDINTLEPDNQLSRFGRLRGNNYSPQSMRSYGNRFRAALTLYKAYLEDPINFRGTPTSTPKPTKTPTKKQPAALRKVRTTGSTAGTESSPSTKSDEAELINYPFPLRNGVMVYLSLPRDLRRTDATRIGAFVISLAIDPVLELESGQEPSPT